VHLQKIMQQKDLHDVLAIMDKVEAEQWRKQLVEHCGTVQFKENGRFSYSGMQIEITDQGKMINIQFFPWQMLGGTNVLAKQLSRTKVTFVLEKN
jgi:hypothetical protein